MLFKPELAQQIANLNKTQTRRPVKSGEQLIMRDDKKTVLTAGGRIKHQVGRDYAVQYKYGKPCRWIHEDTRELMTLKDYEHNLNVHGDVSASWAFHQAGFIKMRIRITDIWQEDVRDISHADALAEGFSNAEIGFWRVWCAFYDPGIVIQIPRRNSYAERLRTILKSRPDAKYQAWAYKFKLLGVQS